MSEFLTRREMANELRISPKTPRRMERDGVGPRPVRLSPRLARYPASAVADFVALAAPAEMTGAGL